MTALLPSWAWGLGGLVALVAVILESAFRVIRNRDQLHQRQFKILRDHAESELARCLGEVDKFKRQLDEIEMHGGTRFADQMRALASLAEAHLKAYPIIEGDKIVAEWTKDKIRGLPSAERRKLLDGNIGLREWFLRPDD